MKIVTTAIEKNGHKHYEGVASGSSSCANHYYEWQVVAQGATREAAADNAKRGFDKMRKALEKMDTGLNPHDSPRPNERVAKEDK